MSLAQAAQTSLCAVLKSLSTHLPRSGQNPLRLIQSCLNCDDPTGTIAVDDGRFSVEVKSVEVKVMSLKEVREAADAVLLFLEVGKEQKQLTAAST